MIIKSFTAESAAAALKQVRSQMGGDAVVLKTRKVVDELGRPAIEVTACIDRPSVAQTSRILSDRANRLADALESARSNDAPAGTKPESAKETHGVPAADTKLAELEARLAQLIETANKSTVTQINAMLDSLAGSSRPTDPDGQLTRLHMMLADADVPDTFVTAFLSSLAMTDDEGEPIVRRARRSLTALLAEMMEPSVTLTPGDTVVVCGPAGAGKTALIGKLAAHLVGTEKKKVRLVSLDDVKIGAHDEILSYAAILGVELTDPTGSNEKLSRYADCVTLIDTPGLPVDDSKFAEFAGRVCGVNATHRICVFSSLMRSSDIVDIAERLRTIQPTHIALSMLDVTSRRGAIVAACEASGARLAWVAESPAGVGTIHAPDPARIAATLIPEEATNE